MVTGPSGLFAKLYLAGNPRPVLAVITIVVLVFGAIVGGVKRAAASTALPAGCSPDAVSAAGYNLSSTVNTTQVLNEALSAGSLVAETSGFPSPQNLSYGSTFEIWNFTAPVCVPIIQTTNAVFSGQVDGQPFNLVVSENPTSTAIESVSLQSAGLSDPSHTPSLYAGYGVKSTNSPSGKWTVSTVTLPSGGCFNYCDIDPWIGQSPNASGTAGISQTGTESEIEVVTGCCTIYSYYAWYEFWPGTATTCFSGRCDQGRVRIFWYDVHYNLARRFIEHGLHRERLSRVHSES
jgi:hypothetical protein